MSYQCNKGCKDQSNQRFTSELGHGDLNGKMLHLPKYKGTNTDNNELQTCNDPKQPQW